MIDWMRQPGGLSPASGAAILGGYLVALLLLRLARRERRAILMVAGLLAGCLVGLLIAGALQAAGLPLAAGPIRAIAVFLVGGCLLSLAGITVFRSLLPAMGVDSPRIIQDVLVLLGALVWLVIWLRVNRVDVTGIVATSAVMTAVIGFALQDTLGNVLGGVAIQLDHSIQVGDWIRVDDLVGRVVEIRWRYTAIETRDWETVIIPNGVLLKNKFLVLGRRRGEPVRLRRSVPFKVDYRYPPAQVIETVEESLRAAEIPQLAASPAAHCLLLDFRDSEALYCVRFWLQDLAADDPIDSVVRSHVYYGLKRAGIPLSIPAHALFLTEETTERRASKSQRDLADRMEVLAKIDLFGCLLPEELARLARRLAPAPFPPDGVITRQGAEADCLYVLREGYANVVLTDGHGHSTRVAELGPGSVFGEMGLVTGEPRSATVIARTEVECFRLDREGFQEIVRSRPALAEEIALLLARRRGQLDSALESLDAESRAKRLSGERLDLVGRIRSFLGMEDS